MQRLYDAFEFAESRLSKSSDTSDVFADIFSYVDEYLPELWGILKFELEDHVNINIECHSEGIHTVGFQLHCEISDCLEDLMRDIYPEDFI